MAKRIFWLIDLLIYWFIYLLIYLFIDRSIGWLVGWLVDWLVGCSVCWLVAWLVGWSVGLLVDRPARLASQSVGLSVAIDRSFDRSSRLIDLRSIVCRCLYSLIYRFIHSVQKRVSLFLLLQWHHSMDNIEIYNRIFLRFVFICANENSAHQHIHRHRNGEAPDYQRNLADFLKH